MKSDLGEFKMREKLILLLKDMILVMFINLQESPEMQSTKLEKFYRK